MGSCPAKMRHTERQKVDNVRARRSCGFEGLCAGDENFEQPVAGARDVMPIQKKGDVCGGQSEELRGIFMLKYEQ